MPAPSSTPPSQSMGTVFSPGRHFSRTTLQSMCLDSILVPVFRDSYIPAGTAITPALRGRAMALATPANLAGRGIAGRLSAAWIYGCSGPGAVISLLVDSGHRAGALLPGSGCTLHEVKLSRFDVAVVGSMPVTTPLRTAVDLAVHVPAVDALPALRTLAADPALNCPLGLIRQALQSCHRVPHKQAALALIQSLLEERSGSAG
ncbi:hypothetical protein IV500_19810 [Paeniglutamicibacter antarcticus]|uniref:AbiEi antitoxin C-terminal domain-containing protein n=1 Tax=Arthrobacter terrae TaxID=2935737 RepID=A0A931CX70_9MICC|nr:hypothetical protein [Arthrobacter terrae]MBG0741608.1 hypothetical protein [Arthrobacter terrae]